MGTRNKLLLPWKGKPLIHAIAEALRASASNNVILVTGHESDRIEEALADYPFQRVHNPDYTSGMTSSIQAGVRAASPDSQAYLIALSDLPRLTNTDIDQLCQTFIQLKSNHPHPILVPTHQGRRGHPLIFDAFYRKALLEHQEPDGCKGILQRYADQVHTLEMSDHRIFADIDRPEDYERHLRE